MGEERERLQGLCDSYALGAIEAEERAELVERIAAGDPSALAALEESKLLLARIADTALPEDPPDRVKQRLMERIRDDAQPAVSCY